jgi:hypothetical protein
MNFDGDFKKIGMYEVSDIQERVKSFTEEQWLKESWRRKKFQVHRDTQSIYLIMDEDGRHTNPTEHPALAENQDILQPLLDYVRRQFGQTIDSPELNENDSPGYFVRMLFVKLLPGGSIPLHHDTGRSMRTSHRIHLPLVTNDGVEFTVGDKTRYLLPGELWEINNRHRHTVTNNGTEGRVHMIMDFVLPGEKIADVTGEILEC